MNTVLVVEDAKADLTTISGYLEQAGYTVISATNSEDAQKKIDTDKPDVILLDVILPDKSGYQICRELQSNPTTSQIPVVFCSTKNSDVDKMWGNMLGAKAYLSKPINKEELEKTLKSLINN